MTWKFDTSLITAKDKIRHLVGDVNDKDRLIEDETIQAVLTDNGSDLRISAAVIAESIAAQFSRRQNLRIDGFSIDWGERAKAYRDLAASLRNSATLDVAGGLGLPVYGGVSISGMRSVDTDTDRNPSIFKTNENPDSADPFSESN